MSEFVEDQLKKLISSVEKLKMDEEKKLASLSDPVSAARGISNSILPYIDETFEKINGNQDMMEVNTFLVTSLAQIRNYLISEPNRVINDINSCRVKIESYSSCLQISLSAQTAVDEENLRLQKKLESQLSSEAVNSEEIEIGSKEDIAVESSLDSKPEHEELWNKPSKSNRPRKIGQRPESLRKIRQEMFKNQGEESQPEDI